MSDEGKIQKRPGRRLRRQREDGASSESGDESDTVFEEASEYESAEEDHESEEEGEVAKKGRHKVEEEGIDDETKIKAAIEDEAEVLVEEVTNLHISVCSTEKSAEIVSEEIPHEEAENGEDDGGEKEEEEKEKTEDAEDSGEEEAVDNSTIGEPQNEGEEVEEEPVEEEPVEEEPVEEEPVEEELEIEEDEEEEDGEEEDGDIEEKRGSGDGQEEPSEENAVELDDDEDLKNPAYIPRKGAYYQHDLRMGDDYKGDKKQKRERRLWKDDANKWLHDKFDESEQAPKSQYEIVNYHGFDIRDPTQQDRMERDGYDRRRGRGRGYRGGRRDGPPRGRGRGRIGRMYSRSMEEDGGGDRGQERESRGYYSSSRPTERRNYEKDTDFPQLPTRGQGDENDRNSESTISYADRVKPSQERSYYQSSSSSKHDDYNDYEEDESNVKIPYQSEKTYYEMDSGGHKEESFKNVSADYRYRPSRGQSNHEQVYLSEGSAPTTKSSKYVEPKSYSHSYSEHNRRRTQPGSREREKNYGEQSQVYPLEFVNKNYQKETESRVDSSSLSQQGDIRKEEELLEQEPQESSRKAYSLERHQRSRSQTDSNEEVAIQESQNTPSEEEGKVDSKHYLHLRNLKIQVKGSERTVLYDDHAEEEEQEVRTNQQDNHLEDDQENQRSDRRERSRPKRYSSQRQRGQELPQGTRQQYYPQGFQGAGDPSRSKGDVPHQTGHPHPQRTSGQGHLSRQQGGGSPGGAPPSGLPRASSSLSPSIQNLMQQGMMMPPEDPMSQGVRPPHLPSPAFFQQHQGNLPPQYYVGPVVNYGAPQYPMSTPLQFQHYPIGMAHSPQGAVAPPAAPPAPPPPQNTAVPSSSQNPSVQQVGGVTYYSPMQQPPPQMRHLPPKRQSKPLTIESPPCVRPPHLPSPAFFQQHQGNLPPQYYVGPVVNYGAPQCPMSTPLQFQHYPIGMAHSPQGAVAPPAAPPAPPPPQNTAVPSSSQNPSVQQVGGVTYYSPMHQPPPQMRHLPPKRQSKPLTIESPP